jgi:acyl-CoA synthetase (AMP-forming)/AMP-acid ligase II
MHLTQSLHKALRECPDRTAVVADGQRPSFKQFANRVQRLAGALQALGLKAGDRVAMMGLNSLRYVEYFQGTWWAGGVINPVNVRWSPQELAYSLDDCDTRILLVDKTFAPMVAAIQALSKSLATVVYCGDDAAPAGMLHYEDLLAAAQPVHDAMRQGDDLAAVMYTGGTTGSPKGVMLSHGNFYLNALASIAMVQRPMGGVGLVAAPFFHVAGCGLSMQLMRRQATQVLIPGYDEVGVMHMVQAERINEMFLVPIMIRRLIEHPNFKDYDFSSLKHMFYGASAIDEVLLTAAMAALPGVQFAQAYGMTELSPTIAMLLPEDHLPGPHQAQRLRSAGRPLPIAEIRIVDGDDNELPAGQAGEICARGPMVMQGYWNKPQATEAALKGGWMHTGDGGYLDNDGYLYVVDRLKDMIVTGGENVYSAEVENALAQLPAIAQSAVIGVPDAHWGERVHAVIVVRPGHTLTPEQVMAHCKGLIAGYKCPRSVEFRTELPTSPAGKLQKFVLRNEHWAGHARRVN